MKGEVSCVFTSVHSLSVTQHLHRPRCLVRVFVFPAAQMAASVLETSKITASTHAWLPGPTASVRTLSCPSFRLHSRWPLFTRPVIHGNSSFCGTERDSRAQSPLNHAAFMDQMQGNYIFVCPIALSEIRYTSTVLSKPFSRLPPSQ